MIKPLENNDKTIFVDSFVSDFKKRLTNLLGFEFKKLNVGLAFEILHFAKVISTSE